MGSLTQFFISHPLCPPPLPHPGSQHSPAHPIQLMQLLWGKGSSSPKWAKFLLRLPAGTAEKLYVLPSASFTRSARHDIGNGQEMSTLYFTAAIPLHFMPHLSSTPTPDLALVQPFLHKHWRLIRDKVQIKSQIYHLIYDYFLWRRLAPCFMLIYTHIWKKMHVFNGWFSMIHRKLKTSVILYSSWCLCSRNWYSWSSVQIWEVMMHKKGILWVNLSGRFQLFYFSLSQSS